MPYSSFRTYVALLTTMTFAILGIACPLVARADDAVGTADAGAARLSYVHGPVAVQRGDANTPNDAVINAPVMGADYVTTGDDARAEVQFDAASMVRLGSNVQMRFTRLDPDRRTMQLAEGTIEVRMLRRYDGDAEVDTPSIGVRPRDAGSYRITVTHDGETLVTVRSGEVDVLTPGGDEPLGAGSTLVARGNASDPSIRSVAAIASDAFDRFNGERDQRAQVALERTARYVNPDVPGVDDLDQYGAWVDDPTYGEVWVPTNLAGGWAPYRDGSWTWEDGYGWTWIGYEPWGWAPYHYGRWFHSPQYGWSWVPPRGPFVVEPWRPALVAFLGFGGPGLSVGVGFGNVGWVPLAPSEPFYPWWGHPHVDDVAITNVNVVYGNARFGGVTAVPGRRFLLGRFDHPLAVRPTELGEVHAMRGMLPVVPTNANLRFSERPAPERLAIHTPFAQRSFAGTGEVVRRTRFEQQRSAIAAAAELSGPRSVPAHVAPDGERPAIIRGTGNAAWSRFNEDRGGGASSMRHVYSPSSQGRAAGQRAPLDDAWHRFERNDFSRSSAPNRSSEAPRNRGYGAPSNHDYAPPQQQRGYSDPRRQDAPPQHRDYGAPQRQDAPHEGQSHAEGPAHQPPASSRHEQPHGDHSQH
jgi:FecR protein